MKGGHVRIRRRLTGGLLILVLLALMLRPGPQALAQTVSHPFIIGRFPAAFIATCAPSTGTGR